MKAFFAIGFIAVLAAVAVDPGADWPKWAAGGFGLLLALLAGTGGRRRR